MPPATLRFRDTTPRFALPAHHSLHTDGLPAVWTRMDTDADYLPLPFWLDTFTLPAAVGLHHPDWPRTDATQPSPRMPLPHHHCLLVEPAVLTPLILAGTRITGCTRYPPAGALPPRLHATAFPHTPLLRLPHVAFGTHCVPLAVTHARFVLLVYRTTFVTVLPHLPTRTTYRTVHRTLDELCLPCRGFYRAVRTPPYPVRSGSATCRAVPLAGPYNPATRLPQF